ncbi:MAG: 2'-5' RNA ligase family protein [Rhodospirillales bacterium]|nr:2'-5' RNA ligase family protein [Rhodospirillales bacterium]
MIAIDILLQPDQGMVAAAKAANARLAAMDPRCYALDDSHIAHVTVLQAFVDAADLDRLAVALEERIDAARPARWRLNATGVGIMRYGEVGLASIGVARTPALVAFQAAVVEATASFARSGGEAGAFVPREDGGAINPLTVADARTFAAKFTGANYTPHVTIGVVGLDHADLSDVPFRPFAFAIAGVAIYQLGDFGTARRRLWP